MRSCHTLAEPFSSFSLHLEQNPNSWRWLTRPCLIWLLLIFLTLSCSFLLIMFQLQNLSQSLQEALFLPRLLATSLHKDSALSFFAQLVSFLVWCLRFYCSYSKRTSLVWTVCLPSFLFFSHTATSICPL